MKISIVVPFYKIKTEYIKECIESIKRQTYRDIEVFLIDDGNRGDIGVFIDECSYGDDRLQVIHQTNMGVSVSRNVGVLNAVGDYIVFVDGDDVLAQNAIENIVGVLENNNPDILFAEHIVSKNQFVFNEIKEGVPYRIIDKKIIMRSMIRSDIVKEKGIHGAPWGKAYKRTFLLDNELFFDTELPRSQDNEFNFRVIQHAKEIFYYPGIVYGYRENADSAMTKYRHNSQEVLEAYLDKIVLDANYYGIFDLVEYDVQVATVSKFFDICNTCILHPDRKGSYYSKVQSVKAILAEERYSNALKRVQVKEYVGASKIFCLLLKKRQIVLFCIAHSCRRKMKRLKK